MYFTWGQPSKNEPSSITNENTKNQETKTDSEINQLPLNEMHDTIVKNFIEALYNRDYITMYYLFEEITEGKIDYEENQTNDDSNEHDSIFNSEDLAAELGRTITRDGKIKEISYTANSEMEYQFEIYYTDHYQSSFSLTINDSHLIDTSIEEIIKQINNNLTPSSSF